MDTVVLTGWGWKEYAVAAAAAMKALGGRQEIKTDVRLVTATNRDHCWPLLMRTGI